MSSPDQLHSFPLSEALQEQRRLWRSAFLGTDPLGTNSFLVLITSREDPTKKVYATLQTDKSRSQITIPLVEHTTKDEIRNGLNLHHRSGGIINPKGYRKATEQNTRSKLLALLNRTSTGADTPYGVPDIFYRMFSISHGEEYDSLQISSFGGSSRRGFNFNATIEPRRPMTRTNLNALSQKSQLDQAQDFAMSVEASIPQIEITPLPVLTYLQDCLKCITTSPSI